MSICVRLNGEDRSLAPNTTVSGLLEFLKVPATNVVVERNRRIVDRDTFDREVLEDGDEVELIRFVGGG
ncbi:MAG: sulfur carrier protein ThiS [Deltaproteobacteria bacterium]|nr:sulfur carrier protein ThiS [Deltaproteobacteria bacterium]